MSEPVLPEIEVRRVPRTRLAILLLLLAAVVAFETWVRSNAIINNSDTPLVLAYISKGMDPSLYPNSAAPHASGSYIPGYQEVVKFLALGGPAWTGMMRLFVVCLVIFLIAMWLILRETGAGTWWAALLVIGSSAVRDSGGGEYWGMSFQVEPLARYLFLSLSLLAVIPLVRTWPRISLKSGVMDLAVVGLLANLHPPSAIGWELVLAVMVLASNMPWRSKIGTVVIGGTLALALALPAAASSAGLAASAGELLGTMPFNKVIDYVRGTQSELFPWVMNPAFAGRILPQGNWLWALLGLYVASMSAWAVLWFRLPSEERTGRRSWVALAAIQCFFLFVLTRYQGVDLCLIFLAYVICRRKSDAPTRIEWLAVGLAAAVNIICWMGSAGLSLIWQFAEIRQITFLVINFSRVSRFVYLPLWLVTGLWVARHAKRETVVPMLALLAVFLTPVDYCRNAAYLVLLAAGIIGMEWRGHRGETLISAVVLAAAAGAAIGDVHWRLTDGNDLLVTLPLAFTLAAAVFTLDMGLVSPRRMRIGLGAFALCSIVLLALGWGRLPREARKFGQGVREFVLCRRQEPLTQLWKWAREKTPKDAVFFAYDDRGFSLYFAGLAQRNVVFCSKGGALLANHAPPPGPEFEALRNYVEEPYAKADTSMLIERSRQLGADYAVILRDMPLPESGDAQLVYANRLFGVIRISNLPLP